MNPVLEYLPPDSEESFFLNAFDFSYFPTPWHYHPEYELVLVVRSYGKRFIGNAVSDFEAGDLSFFGPNLPHLYKNAPEFYENNKSLRASSIVIHFSEKSIGEDFLMLPQAKKIRDFFEMSKQGLDITGPTKEFVIHQMNKMLGLNGMNRLICLLSILNKLSVSADYELISDPGIIGHNKMDTDRLNKIFQYTLKNFERDIRLEEVAALVYMTRTSFCRFFQERTKRSFFSFLASIRLDHSCKLLKETNKSIADITYSCGYNNLSNFNRQFRSKFDMSPKSYRQLYSKLVKQEQVY
jgi:AraC-like DNA-binding protein